MDILNYSLATADDKEKTKKSIKGFYENTAYMLISKNNGKPKFFKEVNLESDGHKIKNTMEVILKRELTEAEKKELLSLKNEKLITKYRTYVDNEISKVYTDNNLTILKEFKNLTETLTAYDKNRNSLKREKRYTDSSYSNGILKSYKNDKLPTNTVKGSQFSQALFEFNGACPGCGETPYLKVISQMFGDRMMVANASGCSSVYSGSAPSTPYTKNCCGEGPAWASSLFEDNAEYGFGMHVGVEALRDRIQHIMEVSMDKVTPALQGLFREWIENRCFAAKTREITPKILAALEGNNESYAKDIIGLKQYLIKKSQWVVGGDGWAYDIGYGGLDHVLASKEDINVIVMDTEVYSNTGGQSSKATPTAAVAKFAAAGKPLKKKDLAAICMSYGHIYVAQVSMGANQQQFLKAIQEAESYNGPSIIIAYSPCINHGIKKGMSKSQTEMKLATECGYWPIFRYNPLLESQGKNPLQLDCKEPKWELYQDYLMGETRYMTLKKTNPDEANELFEKNMWDAQRRWRQYKRLASLDFSDEKR